MKKLISKIYSFFIICVKHYLFTAQGLVFIFVFSIIVALAVAVTYLLTDLTNRITPIKAGVIVNNLSCGWNEKDGYCICIYANGGAFGFIAPDRSCPTEETNVKH